MPETIKRFASLTQDSALCVKKSGDFSPESYFLVTARESVIISRRQVKSECLITTLSSSSEQRNARLGFSDLTTRETRAERERKIKLSTRRKPSIQVTRALQCTVMNLWVP
ncbi:hypothetical protein L798_13201 [Zootermopsis nevadensis]|uniref:Uncharacterized protein n=1 Tax=Zootermopsis nevadensis TaxID=136037 RepID=A0A067QV96_ZOONE|nr:hypothetical protein L798_13201 [Zootermopsis nevadensis]